MLGAIGAAAVGMLFLRLPESPRWLMAAGQRAAAATVCRRFEQSARVVSGPAAAAPPYTEAPSPTDRQEKQGFWSAAGRQHRLRAFLLCAIYFLSP
jgi:hypothetical protein